MHQHETDTVISRRITPRKRLAPELEDSDPDSDNEYGTASSSINRGTVRGFNAAPAASSAASSAAPSSSSAPAGRRYSKARRSILSPNTTLALSSLRSRPPPLQASSTATRSNGAGAAVSSSSATRSNGAGATASSSSVSSSFLCKNSLRLGASYEISSPASVLKGREEEEQEQELWCPKYIVQKR